MTELPMPKISWKKKPLPETQPATRDAARNPVAVCTHGVVGRNIRQRVQGTELLHETARNQRVGSSSVDASACAAVAAATEQCRYSLGSSAAASQRRLSDKYSRRANGVYARNRVGVLRGFERRVDHWALSDGGR